MALSAGVMRSCIHLHAHARATSVSYSVKKLCIWVNTQETDSTARARVYLLRVYARRIKPRIHLSEDDFDILTQVSPRDRSNVIIGIPSCTLCSFSFPHSAIQRFRPRVFAFPFFDDMPFCQQAKLQASLACNCCVHVCSNNFITAVPLFSPFPRVSG